jgi:microcystin-dependent protein
MSARNSYNVAPIPGDNNGGSGGGGGEPVVVGGGVPVGTVLPFAGFTIPQKFALCNGAQLRNDLYPDLLGAIGYNYGVNPGAITYTTGVYFVNTTTEIGFAVASSNPFITVGSYVKLSGYTATVGPNINGVILLITAAPNIGQVNSNYVGTPTVPLPTTGNGSVGTMNRFSIPLPDLRLASPIGFQAGTIAYGTSGGSATTTITADNLPQHRHGYNLAAGTGYASADGSNGNRAAQVQNYTNAGQTYLDSTNTATTNSAISTRNPYVAMNYIIKAET